MNFIEAIKCLADGKKIKQKEWDADGCFKFIHLSDNAIVDSDGDTYTIDSSDMNAAWELFIDFQQQIKELEQTIVTLRTQITNHVLHAERLTEEIMNYRKENMNLRNRVYI